METKKFNIEYSTAITQLTELNESFDKGILRVAYTGKNRNNSFIAKETFEKCIKTIYNIPVVCNYDRETDEIGSHDIEIVEKDGDLSVIHITQPVGVVPESAQWYWEIIEDSGGIHEYLCVEVLIWKRQEAYEKIKANGITKHSMEINVADGEFVDGYYRIDNFCFTALCLLGTAEPCFEGSCLKLFSTDNMQSQFALMKEELKKLNCYHGCPEPDINKNSEREENSKLENFTELFEKYSLKPEDIDFDYSEMSKEDFEAKLVELTAPAEDFSLTAEQFRSELIEAISIEKIECSDWAYPRYDYVDYNPELGEVFCFDNEDWKLYGFTYAINGDVITVDFACKKRKKFSIVDFEEGESEPVFQIYSKSLIEKSAKEKSNEYETKISEIEADYSAKLETANSAVNELTKFKNDTLDEIRRNDIKEVFEKFDEELTGYSDYENLKNSDKMFNKEELENECYRCLGKKKANFSIKKSSNTIKTPVTQTTPTQTDAYGGLFEKFIK